jgi:hypothetical protein
VDDEAEFYFLEAEQSVTVLIMPILASMTAVVLGFGGWNEAPAEDENAVIHPYWHAKHGAVPIFVGNDYLEFTVERPPVDAETLRKLAWEQYLYCTDIVDQGTETITALARALRRPRWFFWWD